MVQTIRPLDTTHPVTCGLHLDSLVANNGLRVHDIFGEVEFATMHAYPMYTDWAAGPLDPDFVPFSCALTSALCGKPTLMEEFGGCTVPPWSPARIWEWLCYGQTRKQFMASEYDLAAYVEQVLDGLLDVGAMGAVLWCYADYDEKLKDQPPCDESVHERWFGLVRPDGSWKPHALVLQNFARRKPKVQLPRRTVTLDLTPEEYYLNPDHHAQRLYQQFR